MRQGLRTGIQIRGVMRGRHVQDTVINSGWQCSKAWHGSHCQRLLVTKGAGTPLHAKLYVQLLTRSLWLPQRALL